MLRAMFLSLFMALSSTAYAADDYDKLGEYGNFSLYVAEADTGLFCSMMAVSTDVSPTFSIYSQANSLTLALIFPFDVFPPDFPSSFTGKAEIDSMGSWTLSMETSYETRTVYAVIPHGDPLDLLLSELEHGNMLRFLTPDETETIWQFSLKGSAETIAAFHSCTRMVGHYREKA